MKLTVFRASDGDCLLLTGKTGASILIDGGRPDAFETNAAPDLNLFTQAKKALDLVCISHIDSDHISGILAMINDLVQWRAYDYQVAQGNAHFPKPKSLRPPEIKNLWHNSFKDVFGENAGAIQDQMVANTNTLLSLDSFAAAVEVHQELVTSIKESLELSGLIGPQALRIPVNKQFGGKTVTTPPKPRRYRLGSLYIRVIGPQPADLDKQRSDWNTWVKANQKAVEDVRAEIKKESENLPMDEGQLVLTGLRELATAIGQRDLVTTPNLASIMLMVQEGKKSMLLTGDGHANDILKGLETQGVVKAGGNLHVDLLKVQHHGAEFNTTEEFCQRVSADHYVFCANGAYDNPDLEVLKDLAAARLQSPGKFTFWFNSSADSAGLSAKNRAYMVQVEALVNQLVAGSSGQMNACFLPTGTKHEIVI